MSISPVKVWRNQKKIKNLLGKTGKIIVWTKVHVPPCNFTKYAPYVVVLVELENSLRYEAQLVDWEEVHLKSGQKVIAVLRRIREPDSEGVIPYGAKFKPV